MKYNDHIDQDDVYYNIDVMLSTSYENLTNAQINEFLQEPANRLLISAKMGFSRAKLNRWYKTTFLNQLNEKITASDKQIIKNEVSERFVGGFPISPEFKGHLRSTLSREYYKPIFDMQISNIIQVWKRAHATKGEINVSILKQIAANDAVQ